jgi:hypothetical protein
MNTVRNEFVTMWIENGILFSQYQKNLVIDLDIAKKIVAERLAFSKGVSFPIMIDFTNLRSVTKDARDYMNQPDGGLKGLTCGAFIGNNAVAVLFINLYLRINKPIIPSKFFTKKDEALEWLQSIGSRKEIVLPNPK